MRIEVTGAVPKAFGLAKAQVAADAVVLAVLEFHEAVLL